MRIKKLVETHSVFNIGVFHVRLFNFFNRLFPKFFLQNLYMIYRFGKAKAGNVNKYNIRENGLMH